MDKIWKLLHSHINIFKISLLCITGFALNFAGNFSIILIYSIFLKKNGIQALPYYYITLNIASIFIGTLLFIKKLSGVKWIVILTSLMGILFLIISNWSDLTSPLLIFIIYTIVGLCFIYSTIFYLNFINQTLTIREIKKYMGLIAGITFSGGAIMAGILIKPALSMFSINFTFTLTGIVYLLAVIPMLLVNKLGRETDHKINEQNLIIKDIFNTDLVKLMALFIFISGIIRYLIDFEFSNVIASTFNNEKDIAGFYGTFNSISKISILLFQILFSGTILRYLSISTTFKSISIPVICFSIISIIYPNFWIIVAFQFLILLLVKAVEQPETNVLMSAIPVHIKPRLRFFIEGICSSIGIMLTGGLIALLNYFNLKIFFFIIFIAGLIYFICTLSINRAYIETIIENLKSNIKKEYEKRKSNISDTDIRLILKQLSKAGADEINDRLLELLDKEKDIYLLSDIIKLLGRLEEKEKFHKPLIKILNTNNHPPVITSSIEALALWGDVATIEHIKPFMFSEDIDIKATSTLAILKISSEKPILEQAVKEIIKMLDNEEPDMRSMAIIILGELGLECFIPAINKCYYDPHIKVRESAVNASLKLRFPSLIKELSYMLKREENTEIHPLIEKVILRLKDATFEEIINITESLSYSDKQRVINSIRDIEDEILLKVVLKTFTIQPLSLSIKFIELIREYIKDRDILDLFIMCFHKEFSLIPFIDNIIAAKDLHSRSVKILEELSLSGAKEVIWSNMYIKIDTLPEKEVNNETRKMCFYIIGISGLGQEQALLIFDNIISKNPNKIDLAIELIEKCINNEKLKSSLLRLIP